MRYREPASLLVSLKKGLVAGKEANRFGNYTCLVIPIPYGLQVFIVMPDCALSDRV